MKSSIRPLANFPCVAAMAALIHLMIFGGRVCAQASKNPQPIATAQLSGWLQPDAGKSVHSTLTFLSDDTVALLLCGDRVTNCRLAVLEFSEGRIQTVAHKDLGQLPYEFATDGLKPGNSSDKEIADRTARFEEGTRYALYRYGAGFVVRPYDFYKPTVQWYSRDLSVSLQVPYPDLLSRSGGTIACRIRDKVPYTTWMIYRVTSSVPPATEEVRVVENLLALSDEEAVAPESKLDNTRPNHNVPVKVQIQSLDGRVLDSDMGLEVTADSDYGSYSKPFALGQAEHMEFANGGRLYLPDWSGRDVIINSQGQRLIRFRPPGEWQIPDRHGWAADGSRLLYDRYGQFSSRPRRIGEDAVMIASIGFILGSQGGAMPPFPDNKNHEEFVRVVDTASGKACFDWMSQSNDIDSLREYHADISPNGDHVAVLTPSKLVLFVLPASCRGH